MQFTYYDMKHVAISLVTPSGGPRAGDTQVGVRGVGFRDFTSGVAGIGELVHEPDGILKQGIKCKFGDNDMVSAATDEGLP